MKTGPFHIAIRLAVVVVMTAGVAAQAQVSSTRVRGLNGTWEQYPPRGDGFGSGTKPTIPGPPPITEPPLKPNTRGRSMKHQRFLRELARDGFVTLSNLPELGLTIRRALGARTPPKRLDNLEPVREAVGKLL